MMNDICRPNFWMMARFGRGRHGGGRWFGGGSDWGFEPRARPGDIRFQILDALQERPRHGYDVIVAIGEKRGSRPSPGNVYPTLQLLEDGGHVLSETLDGKKVYSITDAGRKLLTERPVYDDDEEGASFRESMHLVGESISRLAKAVVQSTREGDSDQRKRVHDILDRARKDVYAILSGDK